MRSSYPLLYAILVAGCATSAPPVQKEAFPGSHAAASAPAAGPALVEAAPPAPAPPPVSQGDLDDPQAYAARFRRPETCEQAARNALAISRDRAWGVLRACVRKGEFTLLQRLLDGTWDHELKTRTDAGLLITQVVAARGGDVIGDLNLLRKRRVPIFALGPASGHPELYRGRLLLVRARVEDVRTVKGKTTVRLAEMAMGGQVSYVEGDFRYRSSSRSRGEASGGYRTSRYGSGTGQVRYSGQSDYTSGYEKKRVDNEVAETGVQAIARLGAPDPFFEPGRQFIVLGRFDGVRTVSDESEEEEAESLAMLSIIGYAEPSAHIVE
jgi:hypothetical protein